MKCLKRSKLRNPSFSASLPCLFLGILLSASLQAKIKIIKKVELAQTHACALTQNNINDGSGKLYCWGSNQWGQLGKLNESQYGINFKGHPVSTQVVNFKTDNQDLKVRDFAVASESTCAILSDDSILCRGHVEEDYVMTGNGRVKKTDLKREIKIKLDNDIPSEVFGAKEYSNSFCVTTNSERIYCWTHVTEFTPHMIKMGKKVLKVSLLTFSDNSPWASLDLCAVMENGAVKCIDGHAPEFYSKEETFLERVKNPILKNWTPIPSIKKERQPIDLSSEKLENNFSSEVVSVTIAPVGSKCFFLKEGKVDCVYGPSGDHLPPLGASSDWHESSSNGTSTLKTKHFSITSKFDSIGEVYFRGYAGICAKTEYNGL